MKIISAQATDAPIIHDLMIQAFMAYKNEVPPSSALDETIESISTALHNGERAFIGYMNDKPVGMIRFQVEEDHVYFYRLSVLPHKQGQGIAKELLKSLETYTFAQDKSIIKCKVRMAVPKNIALYHSIGYKVYDEETLSKPHGVNLKVVSMMKLVI